MAALFFDLYKSRNARVVSQRCVGVRHTRGGRSGFPVRQLTKKLAHLFIQRTLGGIGNGLRPARVELLVEFGDERIVEIMCHDRRWRRRPDNRVYRKLLYRRLLLRRNLRCGYSRRDWRNRAQRTHATGGGCVHIGNGRCRRGRLIRCWSRAGLSDWCYLR